MKSSLYTLLLLAGIAVSLVLWSRMVRRNDRLFTIYIAALTGAFLGAKIVYLAAEGWMFWNDPHRWVFWVTGKTILGALLGGYLAVEIAKKLIGYTTTHGRLLCDRDASGDPLRPCRMPPARLLPRQGVRPCLVDLA